MKGGEACSPLYENENIDCETCIPLKQSKMWKREHGISATKAFHQLIHTDLTRPNPYPYPYQLPGWGKTKKSSSSSSASSRVCFTPAAGTPPWRFLPLTTVFSKMQPFRPKTLVLEM